MDRGNEEGLLWGGLLLFLRSAVGILNPRQDQ
jgi:hypothetical protein